ncbi:SAM-dependent methyltransferase [Cognatilysobacter tabacisoli]|uniref:SAM-dependent methyltransferase n=1 Tax=Cognatilysobacter tabacisoli TaxID=2315424 RepID=UPI000E6B321B|nr:SAM-dependent methyltransferase [Lysobacter tabacisoli]
MASQGSLACVGVGMMLGAHLSPRARGHLDDAEVVFTLLSDALVELWVQQLRPDATSLQPFYDESQREGQSRRDSYRGMVDAILAPVRAGKRVCAVFYGHPGVFASVPHRAIAEARAAGFEAGMEPGISAEDCLYADLGIDPGSVGCQHYEASQFMFYQRRIEPSAYLVLWQVGIAGDRTLRRFATGPAYRRLLVERLCRDYPPEHRVIAYEAATLPIVAPRAEGMALSALVEADLRLETTLVVPPAMPMQRDDAMLARVAQLDRAAGDAAATAFFRTSQGEVDV